jgi:hypothetical protein
MDVAGMDSSGSLADGGQSSRDVPASEDSPAGQSCTYNGKTYPNFTSWLAPDGCNECSCVAGRASCSLVRCDVDAGTSTPPCGHPFGATFPAGDGCNICECHWIWWASPGGVACTQKTCSGSQGLDALPGSDAAVDGCVYDGKNYPADVYFTSADGCDQCHCRTDGQVTCTLTHMGCLQKAGMPDGSVDVPSSL